MSNKRTPRNGAELLAQIQPQLAEVTIKLCLRPDLLNEYNTAVQELEELRAEGGRLRKQAEGSKGGRMASRKSPAERENDAQQEQAARKVRDIEERMAEFEAEFTFQGIPKDEWRDLVDSHPPREGHQVDLFTGYNRDAVLDQLVRPSLVDPEFDDVSWKQLCDLLNAGQWNRLREAAAQANDGVAEVPKSQTASDILSRVAAASKQQSPSASPPAGSKGGSRGKSTTTTTAKDAS